MQGLTIRKYRRGDFDTYVDLLLLTSTNEYSNLGRNDVTRMLKTMDKEWIWVTEADGKAVGFIAVMPDRGMMHVVWLDVHPTYQRMGIGSALLGTAVLAGKGFGIGPIVVEVWVGNEKGLAFYTRHGFRRKKFLQNYYLNGLSAYEMVKDI
jgi:ribosomal protein S18 acetylase RimI-like enzyme